MVLRLTEVPGRPLMIGVNEPTPEELDQHFGQVYESDPDIDFDTYSAGVDRIMQEGNPGYLPKKEEILAAGKMAQYEKSGWDPGAGIDLVWESIKRAPASVLSSGIKSLTGKEGYDPTDKGFLVQLSERIDASNKAYADRVRAESQDRSLDPMGWIKLKDVADLPQNVGFSGASMLGGAAVGLATASVPLPGARPAAWAAGGFASGKIAHEAAEYEFMKEALDYINKSKIDETGEQLTPQEVQYFKDKFSDLARKYGLWEAIPEAIGNVAQLKLFLAPLKIAFPGLFSRLLIKFGGAQAEEMFTETITQMGQTEVGREAAELGVMEERRGAPPLDFTSWQQWFKAFKEVAPQTFLLTSLIGGAGTAGGEVFQAIKSDPELSKDHRDAFIDSARKREYDKDIVHNPDLMDEMIANGEFAADNFPGDEEVEESLIEWYKARDRAMSDQEPVKPGLAVFENDPMNPDNNADLIEKFTSQSIGGIANAGRIREAERFIYGGRDVQEGGPKKSRSDMELAKPRQPGRPAQKAAITQPGQESKPKSQKTKITSQRDKKLGPQYSFDRTPRQGLFGPASTEAAIQFGMKARGNDQVIQELKDQYQRGENRVKELQKAGDLEGAFEVAQKNQFYREAYEVAEGRHPSDKYKMRKRGPRYSFKEQINKARRDFNKIHNKLKEHGVRAAVELPNGQIYIGEKKTDGHYELYDQLAAQGVTEIKRAGFVDKTGHFEPRETAAKYWDIGQEFIDSAYLQPWEDATYSFAPESLGTGIGAPDIAKAFPGASISRRGEAQGKYVVTLPNGAKLEILEVKSITPELFAVAVRWQDVAREGQQPTGVYQDGTIKLRRGFGNRWLLHHESVHYMRDTGLITPKEWSALKGRVQRAVRNGELKSNDPANPGNEEDIADWLAENLYKAEPARGLVGRALEKIRTFLDSLMQFIGRPTAEGVARSIRSGQIFKRTPSRPTSTDIKMNVMSPRWYSQMAKDLPKLIPGKKPMRAHDAIKRLRELTVPKKNKPPKIKADELKWSGLIEWLEDRYDRATGVAANDENVHIKHKVPSNAEASSDFEIEQEILISDPYSDISMRGEVDPIKYWGVTQEQLDAYDKERNEKMHVTTQQMVDFMNNESKLKMSEILRGPIPEGMTQSKPSTEIPVKYRQYATPGNQTNYRELTIQADPVTGFMYQSPHGEEMNNVMHIRFQDVQDADGNNILLIDEIQSDYHQAQHSHYPLTALRRMVRWAVENNHASGKPYDAIAWTTGAGFQGFYDQILPALFKKNFGKKRWGKPRVEKRKIVTSSFRDAPGGILETVFSFPITPEMRHKAETEGFPMYSFKNGIMKNKAGRQHMHDTMKALWESIKSKSPANIPHLTFLEKILKSPEWYDHPLFTKLVDAAVWRSERFHEVREDLDIADGDPNHDTVTAATIDLKHKGLSKSAIRRGKTSKEYDMLNRMIEDGDINWINDVNARESFEEQQQEFIDHWRGKGATEDTIRVWRQHRESYDRALDYLIGNMKEMLDNIQEEAAFAGKDPAKADLAGFGTIEDENGKKQVMTLREAINYMNSWKGFYAPRLRAQGNWVVQAAKGEKGTEGMRREHFRTQVQARKRGYELQREGYDTRVFEDLGVPEDLYQKLRVMSAQQLLDKALEKGEGILDPTVSAKFKEDLIKLSSDLIRARGFRSHMIKRRKDSLVKGYIEDPLERFIRYSSNLSAGIAKNETAEKMMGAMQEVAKEQGKDIEPRVYSAAQRYIEEQMRNNDEIDQTIGMIKSIASLKYLGLPNLRAPFINMTALATTTPAAIKHYATDGKTGFRPILRALMKAGGDYRKYMTKKDDTTRLKNLSEEEVKALDKYTSSGWTKPQQTMDIMGELQGKFGRGWSQIMNKSMWLFGKTEQLNRGTSFLAAFRLARKNGDSYDAAYKKADSATKKAHGVYGKATLPSWAQGTNPLAKVGQMFYVYKKFAHNWLQMAYDLGVKQKDMKAFAWAMASPIVLGGASSLAFKGIFFGLISALMKAMGDDRNPEKLVFDGINEVFGAYGERALRYGLAGVVLNADISGSLSVDASLPPKMMDLIGAPGGVFKDLSDGYHYIISGQPGRALEVTLPVGIGNIIRAGRELSGVTTRRGQPVFDERGRLFTPTLGETAKRAIGFRSARVATEQAKTYEMKKERQNFANRRSRIYELYRAYLSDRDLRKYRQVVKLMKEYNNDLRKSGRGENIPKITTESLKRQTKAFKKPPKAERR